MNNGRTCVLKENGGSKKIPVHPEQYARLWDLALQSLEVYFITKQPQSA